MRATRAIAAFLAALCAACTSSSAGTPSRTRNPPHTTVAPGSTPPTAPTTTAPPPRPTVPADVPRTGPNTRKGEKPPVMPLAATKHTPAGAEAFAEFFIKTIDWGYATTSSAYMRHYYTPSCVGCRSTADALDSARRKRHHFIGDRFILKSAVVEGPGLKHAVRVLTTFDVEAVEVVDQRNNHVDAGPALSDFKELVSLAWSRNAWSVHGFTVQR